MLRLVLVLALSAASLAGAAEKLVVLEIASSDEATRKTARLVEEQVLTEVTALKRYDVAGQGELTALLGIERQKQLLGCADEASSACMAELGGALGAKWLLMGSLGRAGSTLRLDLKLIDAHAGKAVAREGRVVDNEDQLFATVSEVLRALLGLAQAPATGRPLGPFIVGGAGIVAGALGGILMALASGDAQRLADTRAAVPVTEALKRMETDRATYWSGFAVLAVGSAALLGGVLWLVLAPSEPASASVFSVGEAGVEVRW